MGSIRKQKLGCCGMSINKIELEQRCTLEQYWIAYYNGRFNTLQYSKFGNIRVLLIFASVRVKVDARFKILLQILRTQHVLCRVFSTSQVILKETNREINVTRKFPNLRYLGTYTDFL